MTTTMTHNRIKSVQQAITGVLVKRGERGATIEWLEQRRSEMLDVWGHDSAMKEWLEGLDVSKFVK